MITEDPPRAQNEERAANVPCHWHHHPIRTLRDSGTLVVMSSSRNQSTTKWLLIRISPVTLGVPWCRAHTCTRIRVPNEIGLLSACIYCLRQRLDDGVCQPFHCRPHRSAEESRRGDQERFESFLLVRVITLMNATAQHN